MVIRKEPVIRIIDNLTGLSGMRFALTNSGLLDSCSKDKKIIDVGCGDGELLKYFRMVDAQQIRLKIIGLDIFRPILAGVKGLYDNVIHCDARFLPFVDNCCDVAIARHVIEHLQISEGLRLISELERTSRSIIIIITPVGYNTKEQLEYNNPWQMHRSSWHPDDFRLRGFRVYGALGVAFYVGRGVNLD